MLLELIGTFVPIGFVADLGISTTEEQPHSGTSAYTTTTTTATTATTTTMTTTS